MAIRRMVLRASIDAADTDDRAVTVTCSTETMGRDNLVVMSEGIDLTAYRNNPVWLFQHEPDWPVSRAVEMAVADGKLVMRVQFPPAGVSARADEICGLVKAGVINAASAGFDPQEAEPIDRANPKAGTRILRCELQEMSWVTIPALADALVTERAAGASTQEIEALVKRTMDDRDRASAGKRVMIVRGLYDVGRLAFLLEDLGWLKSSAEWEAEVEQDNSPVPAQLGAALAELGAVLVGMAAEEVKELVGTVVPEAEAAPDDAEEAEIVTQAASPAIARFRLGAHRARKAAEAARATAVTTHRPAATNAQAITRRRRMAALYAQELREPTTH